MEGERERERERGERERERDRDRETERETEIDGGDKQQKPASYTHQSCYWLLPFEYCSLV